MKTLLFFSLLLTIGCTDAQKSQMAGYGNKYSVEVLSGGKVVRAYISTGKVANQEKSDGFYFKDSATGRLVEVSGQVIITRLD